MLEFVHLTGADAGKDVQTRRKVRSQAMRDFRRRQRAEKEAATQSPLPTKAVPHQEDETLVWNPVSRSASTSSVSARPGTTKTRKMTPSSPQTMPRLSSSPHNYSREGLLLPASTTAVPEQPLQLYGDLPDATDGSRPRDSYYYALRSPLSGTQSKDFSRESLISLQSSTGHPSPPSIPVEPSTWGTAATSDPFHSTTHNLQMFGFCKSYVQWLLPGTSVELTGEVLAAAMVKPSSNPMLLAACCLASVGHLDAVQPNRPGGNYEVYKARVLREVSVRMLDPETATSDETVGALALLTSFEMSRCSEEALTHLRGIKSILNIKGGIQAAAYPCISMMLETLDLVHAVIFDSVFVLGAYNLGPPTDNQSGDDFAYWKAPDTLYSLHLAEYSTFAATSDDHTLIDDLVPYEALLHAAQAAANRVIAPSREDSDDDPTDIFNTWRQALIDLWDRSGKSSSSAIAQAIYYDNSIFYALVIVQVSPRAEKLEDLHTRLYHSFRAVKDATWTHLPYLRLRILLSGAATSRDAGRKSWFKAQLVRAIYQFGTGEWRRVREFIVGFVGLGVGLARAREKEERRRSSGEC